jgi:type I restriction enzyme S subunit
MSSKKILTDLKRLISPVDRSESIEYDKKYRILGTHWYAKGLFVKDEKMGSSIKARRLNRVEKNDFVYNRLFAWKGAFAVCSSYTAGCYVSDEFPIFKVNTSQVHPKYLWYYFTLPAVWDEALSHSEGGTAISRNRLKVEKFLDLKIPIPELAEQRRIVEKLDKLNLMMDEAEDTATQGSENLNSVVFSIVYHLFLTNKSSWPPLKLENCIVSLKSGFACSRTNLSDNGTPHLRPYNVSTHGHLDLSKIALLPTSLVDTDSYSLKEGDVIFNNTNSIDLVGKSALVEKDLEVGFSNHLTRLRVNTRLVQPAWVVLNFQWLWLTGYFRKISKRWIGQAGINSAALKETILFVPPLKLQKRIILDIQNITRNVNELRDLLNQRGNEIQDLRTSVLESMF